jgi:hypothetical protein
MDISGAHGTHGRDEKWYKIFIGKPEKSLTIKQFGIDGIIILRYILGK